MISKKVFTLQFIEDTLDIGDYIYDLPPQKIAYYPLARRDESKLLIYNKGQIIHSSFRSLADHLPKDTHLIFNNTKVIPARLHFKKDSGATIEVFLLNPVAPSPLLSETMAARHTCTWQCTIGNLKKWSDNIILKKEAGQSILNAELQDRNEGIVRFSWDGDESFAEIARLAGQTPLPPYIKRKAEETDATRYQTIYSHFEGAVAAPTAGLHFTETVFAELRKKNITHDFVTLHVSAGTFQPIKTQDPAEHTMHEEQVIISHANVHNLINEDRPVIAVGTTSMRTLESLYWYGVKLLKDPDADFRIDQDDPFLLNDPPDRTTALNAVIRYMERHQVEHLTGETSIFIRPGYRFRICRGLITNFHQPGSTLILLVAAFIGSHWKDVYNEALANDYRFLSYGDSSLLMP